MNCFCKTNRIRNFKVYFVLEGDNYQNYVKKNYKEYTNIVCNVVKMGFGTCPNLKCQRSKLLLLLEGWPKRSRILVYITSNRMVKLWIYGNFNPSFISPEAILLHVFKSCMRQWFCWKIKQQWRSKVSLVIEMKLKVKYGM